MGGTGNLIFERSQPSFYLPHPFTDTGIIGGWFKGMTVPRSSTSSENSFKVI